jgi:hypothetical protein
MKPSALLLCLLILQAAPLWAGIAECERLASSERDGCYLAKAERAGDCALIGEVGAREQCFQAIIETRAKSYRDCDELYAQHQPPCYARITYENSRNQMACEQLQTDFREECYVYFAFMGGSGDITACSSISPKYLGRCIEFFFERTPPGSPDDCRALFGNAYYEECVEHVNRKTNPIQAALSFVESCWAFMTSPDFVVGASIVVSLAIAGFIAYVVFRTKNKSGGA